MFYVFQLWEAVGYFSPGSIKVWDAVRKAARARHAETDEYKQEMKGWYLINKANYRSMDAAAGEAIKTWPVKFRTARKWIGEFNKDLHSARKV